jgi:hypothetical protein
MKKFIVSFNEEVHVLRRVYAEVECNDESEIRDKVSDLDYDVLETVNIDESRYSGLDDDDLQLEIEKDYDPNPYNTKDFEYGNQN